MKPIKQINMPNGTHSAPILHTAFSAQTVARIHNERAREKSAFGRLETIIQLQKKLSDIRLGKSHLAIAQ